MQGQLLGIVLTIIIAILTGFLTGKILPILDRKIESYDDAEEFLDAE